MMGMMGPGMMGMGPGMMGPGMMGMGQGMMGQGMMGPGMMMGQQANLNLTANDVKTYFERWVAMSGNPRVKVGTVTERNDNTITADIVTTDKDALVQRFAVDRNTELPPNEWTPVVGSLSLEVLNGTCTSVVY
jgi:hypothetical protein